MNEKLIKNVKFKWKSYKNESENSKNTEIALYKNFVTAVFLSSVKFFYKKHSIYWFFRPWAYYCTR